MAATVTVLHDSQHPKGWWCQTQTGTAIQSMCKSCLVETQLGLLVGASGAGKTSALRAFCQENARAVYFCIGDKEIQSRELFFGLACSIGFRPYDLERASAQVILNQIIEYSRDAGPLLFVIDEAQKMFYATRDKGGLIDAVRSLFDAGRENWSLPPCVAVLVAGNTDLAEHIEKRARAGQHRFAAFEGRIGLKLSLKGPRPDDIRALAEHYPLAPDAKPLFVMTGERYNLHRAHGLIDVAKRNSDSAVLNAEDLKAAAVLLGIDLRARR